MSDFHIPVTDLLRSPGSSRRVGVAAPLSGARLALGGLSDGTVVRIEGRLDGLVEGVYFAGEVSGAYVFDCVRCLAEVEVAFTHHVEELFGTAITDESEEGYPLDRRANEVDLEPMVRDAVLLGIPPQPLCDEACEGLCARCGADLNLGPCACPEERGHPAFAVLSQLFPPDPK